MNALFRFGSVAAVLALVLAASSRLGRELFVLRGRAFGLFLLVGIGLSLLIGLRKALNGDGE